MPNNDAGNIQLGPCAVVFDSVDLGYTLGGVEVEVATNTHETQVDQFGETPVNEFITGRTCTVKVPLAETTLDNLIAIMPGAVKVIDGTDVTSIKVIVSDSVGYSLRDNAAKLVLTPKNAVDSSEDFTVPLAMAPGAMSFKYMVDEERVYMAEFKAYPDAAGVMFVVGDETATA
mgnify:CR=1 FL=1